MEDKENIINEELSLKKHKKQTDILEEKDRKFGTDVTNLVLNAEGLIDTDKKDFEINLNEIVNNKPTYVHTMESESKSLQKNNSLRKRQMSIYINPPNYINAMKRDDTFKKESNVLMGKNIPSHPNTSKNRDNLTFNFQKNSGNFGNTGNITQKNSTLNSNTSGQNMKINKFCKQRKNNASINIDYSSVYNSKNNNLIKFSNNNNLKQASQRKSSVKSRTSNSEAKVKSQKSLKISHFKDLEITNKENIEVNIMNVNQIKLPNEQTKSLDSLNENHEMTLETYNNIQSPKTLLSNQVSKLFLIFR